MTPQQARELKALDEKKHLWLSTYKRKQIQLAKEKGTLGVGPDEAADFLDAFSALFKTNKPPVGAAAPPGFKQLVEVSGLTEKDLIFLSLLLVQNKYDDGDRYWGRRLLDSLSAAGYAEATLRIVNNALIQAPTNPAVLKQAAVAIERGRLQAIARKGEHVRAMVLEGKICYFLGDSETAIQWWWRAVEGSVARSQSIIASLKAGEKPQLDVASTDLSDLSTPWIELIEAHFDRSLKQGRNEWDKCEEAIKIGMAQDDPTAFYYAATYYKQRHADGTHLPTSDWLYYMTKAAASSVPKAAYELGVYYAESGWKYLENEPPDHVKPTPFDTYPGPDSNGSLWSSIKSLFASSNDEQIKNGDDMFHTGAWPSTPQDRLQVALNWLGIAAYHTYAPAYLYQAKLLIQETLWAGAQAPDEALNLHPERYLYNSKDAFLEAQFAGDVKTYEPAENAQDPPNPRYDLEKAKLSIRQVMYAVAAVRNRQGIMNRLSHANGGKGTTWDDVDMVEMRTIFHDEVLKFNENSDVFDMWKDEATAMYKEAAAICDHMKWDLYTHEGGLMYKAGYGIPKGHIK